MKSKIIQISTAQINAGLIKLFALCEDGSIWSKNSNSESLEDWAQVEEPFKQSGFGTSVI